MIHHFTPIKLAKIKKNDTYQFGKDMGKYCKLVQVFRKAFWQNSVKISQCMPQTQLSQGIYVPEKFLHESEGELYKDIRCSVYGGGEPEVCQGTGT